MANDISKIIPLNPIKNGTLVTSVTKTGYYDVSNIYVKNTPDILNIQSKFDNRFDDPSYYYGSTN